MRHAGAGNALVAAALFGASTPVAKHLVDSVEPLMLAGMLYLGSGVGLAIWYAAVRRGARVREAPLTRTDAPWLIGAVAFGGVLAPVLLLYGLTLTDASTGALLLNFEGVLTAAVAWLLFREHYSRRLMFGTALIAAAGAVLVGA